MVSYYILGTEATNFLLCFQHLIHLYLMVILCPVRSVQHAAELQNSFPTSVSLFFEQDFLV